MRRVAAVTLALTVAWSVIPAAAQQKPAPDPARGADRSSVGMRSVTGTVKKATEKGLVVVGRETGQKDKEQAFALEAGTRIDAGGKSATELRERDAVTVIYTNRDGKSVAQSVKVSAPQRIVHGRLPAQTGGGASHPGNLYVNVHSAANPNGEIRAQLKPQRGTR